MENIRAAVTEVLAAYNQDFQLHFVNVKPTQEQAGWQNENCGKLTVQINSEEKDYWLDAHTKEDEDYVVTVSQGTYGVLLTIE